VQPSSIPQSHPDIDHRSFQSIPNYHSSFPSFPTDSASSTFDLDAYALPRMEFGGFATDFSGGASQEWVQANQPQNNQGESSSFLIAIVTSAHTMYILQAVNRLSQ
jgi:hypothetical protein